RSHDAAPPPSGQQRGHIHSRQRRRRLGLYHDRARQRRGSA
ncbi:hypothetical protein BN1723_019723, partial [Verticillium longisporum]